MTLPPLIATKFHIPPARADFISRPRLFALLDAGSLQPLTLISAPPGFGKSMLVADWIHTRGSEDIAWLSLDESDDKPAAFWRYFIASQQGRITDLGKTAEAMLTAPAPPPLETILATLINELAVVDEPLFLLIDDYHFIRSPDIHNGLNFFLDHQPANFHLIVLTREDPPLNLSRRRARRQMTEIRATDLRFDRGETAAFLNASMGLTLTSKQVEALEQRTEGWIVGLQMAALSLQGRDPQSFFDSFAGDDRYIADYLIEEVLDHQPEPVRDFLLRTSILDKFSEPLCAALMGKSAALELAGLERANLFLIPLDNTRAWYRYHHLFAELLRQRLRTAVSAGEMGRLYRAASEWCEANDDIHAAIRYARYIPDEVRAVSLLEQNAGLFFYRSELPQLVDFANALPGALLEENPKLCMAIAWATVATRQDPETWLASVERHFGIPAESALADDSLDDTRRTALLEVLIVRQQAEFDTPSPGMSERLSRMQSRLAQLPDGQESLFSSVASLRPVLVYDLGFAAELTGDMERAAHYFEEAIILSRANRNQPLLNVSMSHLAGAQHAQGRLHAACRTYEQALVETSQTPTIALAHAGLGAIHYEWGDLDKAEFHFQAGLSLARAWNQWDALFTIVTGLARISKRRGDHQTALSFLDDFRAQNEDLMTMAQALRLAWVGPSAAALSWLGSHDLSVSAVPTPFNESLLLDVARIFLAINDPASALILSQHILDSAGSGGRNHYTIQANILLSKIMAIQGEPHGAIKRLSEALELAEVEVYLSAFVDEGDTIRALLEKMTGVASAARVLAGFTSGASRPAGLEQVSGPFPIRVAPNSEVLSGREREILVLIAEGCSNQAIASRLVISITTVKTHVGNIFNKLGVRSRTQAIARGETLGLLPRR